mmetsp:Transcript_102943/g.169350  ORF Transcript_102943/g.169350 Transcript_102943/m.169350 type:complete len:235 (+) Transcript_102943:85-789(+)
MSEHPDIQYIPNFITEEQELELFQMAEHHQRGWDLMKTRLSKEWGDAGKCACGKGFMCQETLTPELQKLADALHRIGVFDGNLFPMNSVRINSYTPGQGIFPHCDGYVYFPKVAILSLMSPCNMNFYPEQGTEDCSQWDKENDVPGGHHEGIQPMVSMHLEPRSLLVFGGNFFWIHRHGIDAKAEDVIHSKVANVESVAPNLDDVVPRSRRVSFTMRHLMPRCGCKIEKKGPID